MIKTAKKILKLLGFKSFYGFISPSMPLNREEVRYAKSLIENPDSNIILQFEEEFAKEIGNGKCLSFASGRMAFYNILKALGIKEGDEIVLTGFTCSVMVNAVVRAGGIPIFVDIDPQTFGMSPEDLVKKITNKTRVVVAQHTFGIPCKIDAIKKIAKENSVYLVEDCALSFMSTYKGVRVGDWGDASFFSTDHTKPINTLIGGMAYTNNKQIYEALQRQYEVADNLSKKHQNIIFDRYLVENRLEAINHKFTWMVFYRDAIVARLKREKYISPYLLNDSDVVISEGYYPYPSRLPSFLAFIGLKVLSCYRESVMVRKKHLSDILEVIEKKEEIPQCYKDVSTEIIPLRFIALSSNDSLKQIFDGAWFKAPVINTVKPICNLGYLEGSCKNAENAGIKVINVPIIVDERRHQRMMKDIRKYI